MDEEMEIPWCEGPKGAGERAGSPRICRVFGGAIPIGAVQYFVTSTGNVSDEVVAKYIENQDVEPQGDDDFRITE